MIGIKFFGCMMSCLHYISSSHVFDNHIQLILYIYNIGQYIRFLNFQCNLLISVSAPKISYRSGPRQHYCHQLEFISGGNNHLAEWCTENNLLPNVSLTKERIIYFTKKSHTLPPITVAEVYLRWTLFLWIVTGVAHRTLQSREPITGIMPSNWRL